MTKYIRTYIYSPSKDCKTLDCLIETNEKNKKRKTLKNFLKNKNCIKFYEIYYANKQQHMVGCLNEKFFNFKIKNLQNFNAIEHTIQ